ncbi:septum-promoting GTP-binding protein 1-like isoform X1 [Salvia hispanica]|uniref:septum-promoting GTP-binding protein 1-like isoform X1 n=1 Tax=Salvia hispanica TaxID=49212 RepID=UPI00200964E8|nr:septum-promoting GTP-binding protein 1-like isoform X1 [Salvia hispanica]
MPYHRYTRLSVDSGGGGPEEAATTSRSSCCESDSDLVSLKITMLGDPEIGKTTFLVKYVGNEEGLRMKEVNVNVMDKTMSIQGATIVLTIWDVGGEKRSFDQVPIACKNAAAILFMFDLTSRRTLNSIIGWYSEARKWNQTAVPIIIGTKFDDFMQLPLDIQWTVVTQARRYAKAINAALFFTSATYNINVNKMFKFIMAKIFNLPWTLHRNLTIGEPIIDF